MVIGVQRLCAVFPDGPEQHTKKKRKSEFCLHVAASYSILNSDACAVTAYGTATRRQARSGAMKTIIRNISRFLRSQEGPTVTEYAVMIAVICVAVIGALSTFGVGIENVYLSIASTVPTASGS